jgi:hypothetical protein
MEFDYLRLLPNRFLKKYVNTSEGHDLAGVPFQTSSLDLNFPSSSPTMKWQSEYRSAFLGKTSYH